MYETDKYVIATMPRSGCTYVLNVLKRAMPDFVVTPESRGHEPMANLPPRLENHIGVGLLRSPWSWYVSRWAAGRKPPVSKWEPFDSWLTRLLKNPWSALATPRTKQKARFNGYGPLGPYTWVHVTYHCDHRPGPDPRGIEQWYDDRLMVQKWLRTASLFDDMQEMFGFSGCEHLRNTERNGSLRRETSSYYDNQLEQLVRDADRFIIERYGFNATG